MTYNETVRVALLAEDSKYPNLALMRVSTYHKVQGDAVEWYTPFERYDLLYRSKVFTYTPEYPGLFTNCGSVVAGGTGHDVSSRLPEAIERCQPDYSLYSRLSPTYALGFLTRGCPRCCPWCVVPGKEGSAHVETDLDSVTQGGRRVTATLMDNNFLAVPDFALAQLRWAREHGIRLDFNQGLDARLVDDALAEALAGCSWQSRVRFACDTRASIAPVKRAIGLLRRHRPTLQVFLYMLLDGEMEECLERIAAFRGDKRTVLFAQPFRPLDKARHEPPQWQKDLAHWVNKRWLYGSCEFADFEPRKGFRCGEYLRK